MRVAWIIDDDDEMRQAIKLMLDLLGFEVAIYRDAPSASRDLLAGKQPTVIILDIMMPGVSGIDMLEFMRQEKNFTEIPIVMLSSETTDVQVDEAMDLGADAFVFKPVTLDELENAIQQAISKHS
ncbi:MAG: response regulator [Anaerolineales bacterium]|nr:response regulator [Anaerolineales bacterium]